MSALAWRHFASPGLGQSRKLCPWVLLSAFDISAFSASGPVAGVTHLPHRAPPPNLSFLVWRLSLPLLLEHRGSHLRVCSLTTSLKALGLAPGAGSQRWACGPHTQPAFLLASHGAFPSTCFLQRTCHPPRDEQGLLRGLPGVQNCNIKPISTNRGLRTAPWLLEGVEARGVARGPPVPHLGISLRKGNPQTIVGAS